MRASRQTVREHLQDTYDVDRATADELVARFAEAIDDADHAGDRAEFIGRWIAETYGLDKVRYEWVDEHGRTIRDETVPHDQVVADSPDTTRATTLRVTRGDVVYEVHR